MPLKTVRNASPEGVRQLLVAHFTKNGDSLDFTSSFWKQCEPNRYELERYPMYVRALRLAQEGRSIREIAEETGVRRSSVRRWTSFEQRPKLAHFLERFLELGKPKQGWVWLSVNNTSGHAIPLGPIVLVPLAVSDWKDVRKTLSQLEPLDGVESNDSIEYAFGFLIGIIIGDAAKSRAKNWHRHLGLVLSKRYPTNERIGEFTCECARRVGLKMHRVADQPKPERKPHGFYQWVSQASPLLDWIFNVCLGLRDGERTTYDPVRMEWALSAPEDFRRGFVQGIAESDGSVSVASQTVEFWIGPNWDFFKRMLLTFDVKSFRNREALSVTKRQIQNLGKIPPFSPSLRTARYLRFEKLVNAAHVGQGKRVPVKIRNFIKQRGKQMSIPQISERIVEEFGMVLSFEAVQRWAQRSQK